jgi:hypothetical protein
MSEAPCPSCGAVVDVLDVFGRGECPHCETALAELHAAAVNGGGES